MKFLLFISLLFVSTAIYSQAPANEPLTAKPLKGEGIHSLLQRHHINPAEYIGEFLTLNPGKFGKDGGLLEHHTYVLPRTTHMVTEPLFGEAFKEVTVGSKLLKGATLFLVSGHGGPDPGAIGHYGANDLYEDEYAYDITLRLARNLMENGATVEMIVRDPNDGIRTESLLVPDKDETCLDQPIPLNQMERLKQRATTVNQLSRANKNGYQRCLVIHLDSRSQKEQLDVFFYHHQRSKTGKEMALTVRHIFEQNYSKHQPRRSFSGTVTHRNLYMLRRTTPVTVFVELGNIRNFRDQQRFVVENNRQALANWLCQGIIEDYQNHVRGKNK